MKINLDGDAIATQKADVIVLGTFNKKEKKGKKDISTPLFGQWDRDCKKAFLAINIAQSFTGDKGTQMPFDWNGRRILAIGLGNKKDYDSEAARRTAAAIASAVKEQFATVAINLDTLALKADISTTTQLYVEGLKLSCYAYDKYLNSKKNLKTKEIIFHSKTKKTAFKKIQKIIDDTLTICESVNIARDFVNEPPNVLNSETYAKAVIDDIKGTKGVRTKILGKADLKKHKMAMFLSVNAGSAFAPQLVHLTYTPAKMTKNTKHIALVGKGITFDTGGYSLKPSSTMVNMKFDMAGSATVYGAFRAIAKLSVPIKVSCFLGITDNAVNSLATMPDSIVTAKNGKTVEILNTDAEGRLVLGDILTYASEQKPHCIIDVATLTGACLVALGSEVCGLMSNDKKLTEGLKKAAASTDEYIWELPIIREWRDDMKSKIADLKNIGSNGLAGTAKAAAFLENFVDEDIPWAHLDIAGCGDSQGHLPYCPQKGASGLMVRTLVELAKNL